MTHAKIQHYVPRFLLRGFEVSPESEQVHAFDKSTGRSFCSNIQNVGAEKAFYDLAIGEVVLSFEPALGKLESAAALLIEKIRARSEIGFLAPADRRLLAQFVMVQFFRTRQFRNSMEELGRLIRDTIAEDDPGAPERLGFPEPTEDAVRVEALHHLETSIEWAPLIESKAWAVYEAPNDYPFWLSDHPVVLHNELNQSDVRGTIGFGVPGIEIYLPISRRLCLGFICPSVRAMFDQAYAKAADARDRGAPLNHHEAIGSARDGFEYGYPIPCIRDSVDYINSLGVLWAERFIFASRADFALAEQMIAQDPKVRRGPRPSRA